MKEKLLMLLTDATGYLSGEAISHELCVSRTAVWKAINKLKAEGYQIDSVRNKGYRLEKDTTELVVSAVQRHLPVDTRFKSVKVYDTIDSTNTEAKRLYQSGLRDEALVVSREQTGGKGRRGRHWSSPMDESLSMSLLLLPDIPPVQASMLTLVAGLSACQALETMLALKPSIKWPNDLVIEGKKICGILTEMSAEMDYVHHVVVGIGVNVNQLDFPEELVDIATSLKAICGKSISRPELIGYIIEAFETNYSAFLRKGDLSELVEAYNIRCINVGKDLIVTSRESVVTGEGIGILPDGNLQIRLHNDTITTVNAGEVSVRGLYGYV